MSLKHIFLWSLHLLIQFKWNLLQLLFRYKELILEVDLSGLVLSFPLLEWNPFF